MGERDRENEVIIVLTQCILELLIFVSLFNW